MVCWRSLFMTRDSYLLLRALLSILCLLVTFDLCAKQASIEALSEDIYWLCKEMKVPKFPRPKGQADHVLEQFNWSKQEFTTKLKQLERMDPLKAFIDRKVKGARMSDHIHTCRKKIAHFRVAKLPKPEIEAQKHMMRALSFCHEGKPLVRKKQIPSKTERLYKHYVKHSEIAMKIDPMVSVWKQYEISACETDFVIPYLALQNDLKGSQKLQKPLKIDPISMIKDKHLEKVVGLTQVLKKYRSNELDLHSQVQKTYRPETNEFFILTANFDQHYIYSIKDNNGNYWHLALTKDGRHEYKLGHYLSRSEYYMIDGYVLFQKRKTLCFKLAPK